jgi:hypothetical protein
VPHRPPARWLVTASLLVAACVALVTGCSSAAAPAMSQPPTVWLPSDPDIVPAEVVHRTPLLLCGVVGAAQSATVRACMLDALAEGRSAEMVMELPRSGMSTVLILRVLPGQRAELFTGSPGPGLRRLWQLSPSCKVGAAPRNTTDLSVDCGGQWVVLSSLPPADLPNPAGSGSGD